jgi:transglutaminase-like putative cysteine protease
MRTKARTLTAAIGVATGALALAAVDAVSWWAAGAVIITLAVTTVIGRPLAVLAAGASALLIGTLAGGSLPTFLEGLATATLALAVVVVCFPDAQRPWVRSLVIGLPLVLAAAVASLDTEVMVALAVACLGLAIAHARVGSGLEDTPTSATPPVGSWARGLGIVLSAALATALVMQLAPSLFADLSSGPLRRGDGSAGRFFAFGAERMDLQARGDLPATPMWSVPADSPQLWRSQIFLTYDGRSWTTDVDAFPFRPLPSGPLPAFPGDDGAISAPTSTYEVRAEPAALGTPGVAPGRATQVVTAGDLIVNGFGTFVVGNARGGGLSQYSVASQFPPLSPANLNSAPAAPPGVDQLLQLPDVLPTRLVDLAGDLRRADAPSTASAIYDHLMATTRYDLKAPVPGADDDAVDHFLFESGRGFCEHYASAQAILLRLNGIPSRVVVGFTGGESGPTGRTLRASDAHAWVEYWTPGAGWTTADPTAGSVQYRSSSRALLPWGLGAALAALLAVAAWFLVRYLRRRFGVGDRAGDMSDGTRPLDAFARLERRAARAGLGRRPGETVRTFGARVAHAGPTWWRSLAVVEQDAYAADPPNATQAHEAVRDLDGAQLREPSSRGVASR